jgi:DNA (cytosine-5)-methyltransferase 1
VRIGSLFSGVGGLELGLEWAGVGETYFQVELDPFCSSVLAKFWPHSERFGDVHDVGAHNLPSVDVLCGGFPCQDISLAGRGAGLDGKHSGLWREYARIIRELRPEYVVVENVAALLRRGLSRVLADLAECGYDAEWSRLSARNVGAKHRRERIFIIAYAEPRDDGRAQRMADADDEQRRRESQRADLAPAEGGRAPWSELERRGRAVADADGAGRGERLRAVTACATLAPAQRGRQDAHARRAVSDADCTGRGQLGLAKSRGIESALGDELDGLRDDRLLALRAAELTREFWAIEPDVGRVVDGLSAHMDCIAGVPIATAPPRPPQRWKAGRAHRLRALGNAVVPQCAAVVGRRLMQIHAERCAR